MPLAQVNAGGLIENWQTHPAQSAGKNKHPLSEI